jgi:hypothetical protein
MLKIVPVALVALTALATVGSASAHDAIIPRDGFDTALVSAGLDTGSKEQPITSIRSGSGPHNPASSDRSAFWKDY